MTQIGLGCWPLSGAMTANGASVGYTTCKPQDADRILHAAVEAGITLFDTAQAYGAGNGERIIGETLKAQDVQIVTKIGLGINEGTSEITGFRLNDIQAQVHESLSRLQRDHIDVVLLHPNETTVDEARPIMEALDREIDAGTIGSFGWSTDFPDKAALLMDFPRARHIECMMNVFYSAKDLLPHTGGLTHLIRSPLAMGVLAGRFDSAALPEGDVRKDTHSGMDWFADDGVTPRFAARLDAIRELLTSDGRTLAQGALGWLLANGNLKGIEIVPIPGASSVAQVQANAQATALPAPIMDEISQLIPEENFPGRGV